MLISYGMSSNPSARRTFAKFSVNVTCNGPCTRHVSDSDSLEIDKQYGYVGVTHVHMLQPLSKLYYVVTVRSC